MNKANFFNNFSSKVVLGIIFFGLIVLSVIVVLSSVKHIKNLCVWGASLSDISSIGMLDSLEKLVLIDNDISNVDSLKGMHNLQKLCLQGNPLTEEQVNELREALPNCDIVF